MPKQPVDEKQLTIVILGYSDHFVFKNQTDAKAFIAAFLNAEKVRYDSYGEKFLEFYPDKQKQAQIITVPYSKYAKEKTEYLLMQTDSQDSDE